MLSEKDKELIAAATDAISRRYRNDWQEVGAALRTRDGRIDTPIAIPQFFEWHCCHEPVSRIHVAPRGRMFRT